MSDFRLLQRELEAGDRRRGSIRQGLARAVFDRRERLSDRAARRRHSAHRRRRWCGPSRSRRGTACRSRREAAARRRPGQSIGAGHRARYVEASQPDPRDQSGRAMGARRAGRRARRAERRAAAAQPALRSGCVVGQPRHRRRHDGQQLERRALGAVRQDDRSRARTARRAVRRRARAFSSARSRRRRRCRDARRQHRGARVSRHSGARRQRTPPRSSADFPKCCGASAATTSMRSSIRSRPVDLTPHHGRLRRHARLHRRREDRPGAAAGAEVGADDRVRSPARCARRDAGDPEARAVGRRSDGRLHPVARQEPSAARRAAARDDQRRRIGAAVRGVLRRSRRRADAQDGRRSSATSQHPETAPGARRSSIRRRSRRSGASAKPRSGLSTAMKSRRQGDLVRRRHRGRAGKAARLHRAIHRHRAAPRHDAPASTRMPRSDACTCGRWSISRPRTASRSSRRSPTRSRIWCSSSAARCRASTATAWCAARSTRRCSGRSSTRRFGRSRRRSIPTASSIPAASSTRRRSRRTCGSAPVTSTPSPATVFDFSDHDGFGRAVEMCSGVGLCRKKREGTMCPSYMVTREEAHSTRGRANTLRLAMSGQLGDAKLSDAGVHEVLDLCLECRACKSECPVGVDVARFKSEFLAGYWDRHGMSLRGPGIWQRAQRGGLGQPLRAAVERDREQRDREVGGGDNRSASIAGGRCRSGRGRRCGSEREQEPGSADRGRSALLFADTFTESRRSGDRPRGDRRDECRRHRHAGRAERLLRPAADLTGPPAGGAPPRRGERPCALRRGASRPGDRVRRAELPVGGSRRRAGSAARRAAAARARGRAATSVLFEEFLESECAQRPRHAGVEAGAARDPAPSALPPAIDGAGRAGQGAAVADPVAQRSSISMPAAAAWPDRSATRAIITMCRARSPSVSCCRRRGR